MEFMLLDEILRGEDPRTSIAEAKPSEGSSSGRDNSSPAPAQLMVLLKLDMVDLKKQEDYILQDLQII